MKELRQYLRDRHGNPRGVIIATGKDQIGWSVAHPRDKFNKDLGLRIARGRAEANRVDSLDTLPSSHLGVFAKMQERAEAYFK